jgi:sugar lactone lactonase YvrE
MLRCLGRAVQVRDVVVVTLIAGTSGTVLAAAGCSSSPSTAPQTASLAVTIAAPSAVTPAVTVNGPAGYTKVLSATTTLTGLAVGNYTVIAAPVTTTNPIVGTFNTATVTGSPATVAGGATAVATATYTQRPGSGGMWVGNGAITQYKAGQLASSTSAPAATAIFPTGNNAGVAFDAAGNLWVSELTTNVIVEFTASQLATSGNPTPAVTLSANAGSVAFPGGLAFDAAGNLWVANEDDSSVVEFAASQLTSSGSPVPAVTISASAGSLKLPAGLAFDASGNLWVANIIGNTVVEFTPGQLAASGAPKPAITLSANGASLGTPRAPAFDASGNLWVLNVDSNTVSEFTRSQLTTTGSPVPAVMLTSAGGSLEGPTGLAFDASGDLWITNGDGDTIVEFTGGQLVSGSPTPAVIISGSSVDGPWGLAFDPHAANLPLKP